MSLIKRNLKIFSFIAAAIAGICIALSTAQAEGPAGILLYCRHGQEVFLLLADDRDRSRGWGSFGGGAHRGETLQETATRETEEETRSYFSRTWLKQQVSVQHPLVYDGFASYFVEVPFVPAQRVMNNPTDEKDISNVERQFYAWIPFSEIEGLLHKENPTPADLRMNPLYVPPGCESDFFWSIWIRSMRNAMINKAFPWEHSQIGSEMQN